MRYARTGEMSVMVCGIEDIFMFRSLVGGRNIAGEDNSIILRGSRVITQAQVSGKFLGFSELHIENK